MRFAPSGLLFFLSCLFLPALATPAAGQQGYYAAGYHAAQAAAMQRHQHEAAWQHYYQQLAAWQAAQRALPAPQPSPAAPRHAAPSHAGLLRFDGRYASVHASSPSPLLHLVRAGNSIQGKPYRLGGGHRHLYDSGYDCSGSVSYVLIHSGLLRAPLSSKEFANYGKPGPGRFITLYVKPGEHVFMTVCGLRFDTTGGCDGEGPRWRPQPRSTEGFILRHPPGL